VSDAQQSINHQNRQPGWVAVLCAVLLLGTTAIFWGAYPTVADAGTPQASIGQTTFDFGKIFENQPLTHTFVVKNTGTAPLVIEYVDPDCACTVANYDKTIPPGGQGSITLTIKPYSVIHQFKKDAKVTLNDPEHHTMNLSLIGVALPFIEIQPSYIVRLEGAPGDPVQKEVRFISHLPGPWKITGYSTTIPAKIEINLKPEVPNQVYDLYVRNVCQQAGRYAGVIYLYTTSKERPRLIVRVFGALYLPSAGGQ
jgi:hypothetical protein